MQDDAEYHCRSVCGRVAGHLKENGHRYFGLFLILAGLGCALVAPIALARAAFGDLGHKIVSVIVGLILASTGPTCMKRKGIAASGAGVLLLAAAVVFGFLIVSLNPTSPLAATAAWGGVAVLMVAGVALVLVGLRSHRTYAREDSGATHRLPTRR